MGFDVRSTDASTGVPLIEDAPSTVLLYSIMAAGANAAGLKFYKGNLAVNYKKRVNWLTGNNTLTAAMMLYDIQGTVSGAPTTIEIPLNATLGLDYTDTSVEYVFKARNYGAGGLSVNAAVGVTLHNYYDLDLLSEGPYHKEYTYSSREEDVWFVT